MSQPLKVLLADTREVDDSNEVMPAAVLFAFIERNGGRSEQNIRALVCREELKQPQCNDVQRRSICIDRSAYRARLLKQPLVTIDKF